jgi:hypothetical protein
MAIVGTEIQLSRKRYLELRDLSAKAVEWLKEHKVDHKRGETCKLYSLIKDILDYE